MYSRLTLARKYLNYLFTASNGKGHGIHSPFVFEFITQIMNDTRNFYAYESIERLRHQLKNDQTVITIDDFGAGSVHTKKNQRSIRDVARHAAKNKKLAQLLFRIAGQYQPKKVLELGTSLGISTAYLASANPMADVITIEGSPSIASVANKNFSLLGLNNIHQITGKFDDALPEICRQGVVFDLIFIDGNHRKEPTLRYFNDLLDHTSDQSIIILDDIHWSEEMEQTWNHIRQNGQVTLTIDLFFTGLIFLRKDFKEKQDFVIRF